MLDKIKQNENSSETVVVAPLASPESSVAPTPTDGEQPISCALGDRHPVPGAVSKEEQKVTSMLSKTDSTESGCDNNTQESPKGDEHSEALSPEQTVTSMLSTTDSTESGCDNNTQESPKGDERPDALSPEQTVTSMLSTTDSTESGCDNNTQESPKGDERPDALSPVEHIESNSKEAGTGECDAGSHDDDRRISSVGVTEDTSTLESNTVTDSAVSSPERSVNKESSDSKNTVPDIPDSQKTTPYMVAFTASLDTAQNISRPSIEDSSSVQPDTEKEDKISDPTESVVDTQNVNLNPQGFLNDASTDPLSQNLVTQSLQQADRNQNLSDVGRNETSECSLNPDTVDGNFYTYGPNTTDLPSYEAALAAVGKTPGTRGSDTAPSAPSYESAHNESSQGHYLPSAPPDETPSGRQESPPSPPEEPRGTMAASVVRPDIKQVRIGVNLVRAAKRLLSFLATVDEHKALYQGPLVSAALRRYEECWLPLLARGGESEGCAPPLDVHWVWLVHMLAPQHYHQDCLAVAGVVVPHRLTSAKPPIRDSISSSKRF
ncbi:dentin sialophosphoprotein-like [Palaemon carinicauda]|uniref:dentin sialophosphoprotein-like n=1 Tax=Palaemon carinicauda TaxID=392227 RepID=UPI0035B67B35